MHRRSLLALPLLALPATLRAQARPRVVASFSILGDMVRQVAGDRVELRTIAGPNVDAHSFQPRPSDAEAVRGAALVVRNGLGFDGWMDRMVRAAGYRGPVATTTDGIEPRSMPAHSHGHSHGGGAERRQSHSVGPRLVPDPHAWQDLRHGIRYLRNIACRPRRRRSRRGGGVRGGRGAHCRAAGRSRWLGAVATRLGAGGAAEGRHQP
jgi:zinc/manganese transport system substrate-binding protein